MLVGILYTTFHCRKLKTCVLRRIPVFVRCNVETSQIKLHDCVHKKCFLLHIINLSVKSYQYMLIYEWKKSDYGVSVKIPLTSAVFKKKFFIFAYTRMLIDQCNVTTGRFSFVLDIHIRSSLSVLNKSNLVKHLWLPVLFNYNIPTIFCSFFIFGSRY